MRKVAILPLDGYGSSQALIAAMEKLLDEPGLADLVRFIKLNDGVHNLDAGGPFTVTAIQKILADRQLGIGLFLDLKVYDVSATVENILRKYLTCPPDILTVSSGCSVEGIIKLRKLLPTTKLAMISTPTDISRDECLSRFGQAPEIKIFNDLSNIATIYHREKANDFSGLDKLEPFDMVVCSPKELKFLRPNLPRSYEFIVPGIRDAWMLKKDEHQKRTTGVREALEDGATYVVMGAQLTKGNPEREISPEESRTLTQGEVAKARQRLNVYDDPLLVLKSCDGYYCSPQNEKPLGPLVAYAGTYESGDGPKNYVGFEYFNFARAEANSEARSFFAERIALEISLAGIQCDLAVGAPMGGILLSGSLSDKLSCRSIFAEKKILGLANPAQGQKEQSQLVIDRHEISNGDRVIIVEDVCNNFSTTQKLEDLIEERGGELVAIVCAINRSGHKEWNGIPVLSAAYLPSKQWRQDDPEVADLIAAGSIVWKPKAEWAKLKAAMG